jgi:ABC-type nitrate/sulfonate/bicarbonate transport system ATPase subunit
MTGSALSVRRVSHRYGDVGVLAGIDLAIAPGELVAVVGPSGCGKTTFLNLLSGYESPCEGVIERQGTVRTIYQQDGLLPWLTVAENIRLGLRHERRVPQRDRQLEELLALVRLEGFEAHYPHQLSGGMRQRVELARVMAARTDLLLMDEPFSALDYQTRLLMRRETARLLHERPTTLVYVTHDLEEAAQLADRVLVFSARPARIVDEVRIDLERPRDPTHPVVVAAVSRLMDLMGLREPGLTVGR